MILYTEQQAAALLGLSRRTLKRERGRGAIEYTQLGQRTVRYTQAQIDTYLTDCRRREPQPEAAAPRMRIVAPRPPSNAAASLALARSIIAGRRKG